MNRHLVGLLLGTEEDWPRAFETIVRRTGPVRYFETERYLDFCASRLGHLDEVVLEWVDSPEFDTLLVETVRATYPAAEHDRFVAHFRGLVGLWVTDTKAALQPTGGQFT